MNRQKGFTLIELMFTLLVVAISVSLAVPTFQAFREKRNLTAAAEDIASYVRVAQSLAIKKGRPVSVSWRGSNSHSAEFCIGLAAPPKDPDCDCRLTDPLSPKFCSIDGVAYRLQKQDFVRLDREFMHFRPAVGHFSFGPVRGIIDHWSDAEIIDEDWLMYMHSHEGSGSTRLFGLEFHLGITGRFEVCQQTSRASRVGVYPECS